MQFSKAAADIIVARAELNKLQSDKDTRVTNPMLTDQDSVHVQVHKEHSFISINTALARAYFVKRSQNSYCWP